MRFQYIYPSHIKSYVESTSYVFYLKYPSPIKSICGESTRYVFCLKYPSPIKSICGESTRYVFCLKHPSPIGICVESTQYVFCLKVYNINTNRPAIPSIRNPRGRGSRARYPRGRMPGLMRGSFSRSETNRQYPNAPLSIDTTRNPQRM
ncbi:hypothetical protein KY285_009911 [Solanum tuberosum]|nr:hypothetical protein KY285_009911 [Solanum tuberosum]